MLNPEIVATAKRLIACGIPRNAIAKRLGISRSAAQAIASKSQPKTRLHLTGPRHRCPECGGLIYGECSVCELRRSMAVDGRRPAAQDGSERDLQPVLFGPIERRYVRMRQSMAFFSEDDE